MFDNLSEKFQNVIRKLSGKGRISEADVNDAMREVRLALLEADVNLQVVRGFISRVKEKAIGSDVLESLSPGQQVIKIVNDELIELLGGTETRLELSPTPPTVIMLCGLQGAGKTTLCGKLARWFKKQGRNPMMVACDIYRPAAVKQLQVLGGQVNVPVFTLPPDEQKGPPAIARRAIQEATQKGLDIVILDTAGRLAIDDELMDELGQMKAWVKPHEILLVVDAMVGQDAVNFATRFNESLGITGFVMTKMDGDTRGGAALSIREVTGVPIKFLGIGEKLDALEQFHPDRLASRILGMGDVLTLIERAQEAVDAKQAEALEQRLLENKFDLEDFLEQLKTMRRMGPMEQILKMIPGLSNALPKDFNVDPKILARKEAVVFSMTRKERRNPQIINGQRRKRIAAGCGQSIQEVNQFLAEFEEMRKMIRQVMKQQPPNPEQQSSGTGKKRVPTTPQPISKPSGNVKKLPKGGRRSGFPFGR